jgi:hypothetical protein
VSFPTIRATAQWDCGNVATTLTKTVLPAGIVAGDLLLVCVFRVSAVGTGAAQGTWIKATSSAANTGNYDATWFYKVADGTEAGTTQNVSLIGSDKCGTQTYVLTAGTWGDFMAEGAWSTPSSTLTPDPPSLTTGFGAVDTLWIEVAVSVTLGRTMTPSTGYGNLLSGPAVNVGAMTYASARKTSTAASDDPNAVTWSGAAASSNAAVFGIRGPVAKSASDSGAGADTSAESVTITATDAGTAVETAGQLRTATDTGAGVDGSLLAVTHVRTDTGAGVEAIGNRTIVVSDTGTGVDMAFVHAVAFIVTTRPGPTTLADVLRGSHTPVARLLFLEADLDTVIHAVDAVRDGDNRWLLAGSVQMDRTADVHRTATASLINKTGLYSPIDGTSLVWPNRIIRIERGAMVGDTPQYEPLITGLLDNWKVDASSGVVGFSVWSRLHQADQQFSDPVTYAAGMSVGDAIRDMAERAGMGTTDAFYAFDDGGLSLPTPRSYDTSDNMLKSMVKLAFDNGLDLYDDGLGVIVLLPFVDPMLADIAWEFVPGPGSVLTDLNRSGQATTVYNRAVVVGVGPDGYPIRAEARVLNPDDPLYNPVDGTGPLGDKPRPTYTTYDVTGQQALNDLAFRLLVEGALYQEAIAANANPIPLVKDRNVVRFAGAGADDRYLLDKVTIGVGPGAMGMSTRKVRGLLA